MKGQVGVAGFDAFNRFRAFTQHSPLTGFRGYEKGFRTYRDPCNFHPAPTEIRQSNGFFLTDFREDNLFFGFEFPVSDAPTS